MQKNTPFQSRLRPLAAATALACSLGACGQKAPVAPAAPAAVTVAKVLQQDVIETQEFSGRIEAVEQVAIRPRVGGYITAIHFTPGSKVRKGQLLFEIDPRPYAAEAARATGAVQAMQARADLARLELRRAELLLTDKAIAQREFDEKAAGLKELLANLHTEQARLDLARLNLEYTRVLSPVDGRVSKAELTLGNLVEPSTVLTSVVSIDRVYASFEGDEASYLRVARQQQQGKRTDVRVGLANEAGFPHAGQLEFVDNKLDTATGSVRMRATFANEDQALVPGLFARVQLVGGNGGPALTRALLINERAVGTDQNRKFVIVIGADNKAEFRPVKLGPEIGGLRLVREGVRADERIVVGGLQRVRPGDAVDARMVPMNDTAAPAAAAASKGKA